ncbi:MAG: hypothetical protein RIQ98_424, partial [Bacteroidota bacterium]
MLTAVLVVCSVSSASGQSWADILKEKAAQRAVGAADQTIDKGSDAPEGAVRCVVDDQACIDQARQQGNEVVLTNKKGKPLPADQQPKSGSSAGAGQTGTPSGADAGSSSGQPNLTAVKSDFVPGD